MYRVALAAAACFGAACVVAAFPASPPIAAVAGTGVMRLTEPAETVAADDADSSSSSSAPEPVEEMVVKKRIKAVIFDLDGTLLDTEALSDRAILDAFGPSLSESVRSKLREEENYRLPWEIKRRILGLRGSEWIPMVYGYAMENWGVSSPVGYGAGVDMEDWDGNGDGDEVKEGNNRLPPPPPSVDEFWRRWEDRLSELCVDVRECPGATELCERLYELGVPLAIATSSRSESVAKKRINHERMFRCIPTIVCGDDPSIKNGKPAPDMYLEAARRLGVDPCDCLVFEDAKSGVRSGRAAGCYVAAVPDPRMDKEEFLDIGASEVLDDLSSFDGRRWGIDIDMRSSANAS